MNKYIKDCLEQCTPYGHDDSCPNLNLQNAPSRHELMKEVDALLLEIERLKEEIEELRKCLGLILEYKSPDYLKSIKGKSLSIFDLVKETLKTIKQEERIEAFHAGVKISSEKH